MEKTQIKKFYFKIQNSKKNTYNEIFCKSKSKNSAPSNKSNIIKLKINEFTGLNDLIKNYQSSEKEICKFNKKNLFNTYRQKLKKKESISYSENHSNQSKSE